MSRTHLDLHTDAPVIALVPEHDPEVNAMDVQILLSWFFDSADTVTDLGVDLPRHAARIQPRAA